MQVTLPIDVVIKSVRKRAGQHWVEVLASERQYRKRIKVYDKTAGMFFDTVESLTTTLFSYGYIIRKSPDPVTTILQILKSKYKAEKIFTSHNPLSLDPYSIPIGVEFGVYFYTFIPLICCSVYPERKVNHTKLYSDKLKELQELKRLGATEVTLTPEDEKFLDLTIDRLKS